MASETFGWNNPKPISQVQMKSDPKARHLPLGRVRALQDHTGIEDHFKTTRLFVSI